MELITLNDGNRMPMLGYGTYKVRSGEECVRCVLDAIRTGYRLIDTAQYYDNEAAVGEAVAEAIRLGLVKREELFITTKLWFRSFEDADARKALEESFRKLKLEQVDLVLLHWPFGNVYAAWRVLEEYKEAGRIRSIGVSNMEPDRLIDLIQFNRIPPAVNQIEGQLYCQRKNELAWMKKYHVAPQAYSPFGSNRVQGLLEEPLLAEIGARYGKTPAQITLRYLLRLGFSVIPKAAHPERMRENMNIFDFELTEEEAQQLAALDRNKPRGGMAESPERVENCFTWPDHWMG